MDIANAFGFIEQHNAGFSTLALLGGLVTFIAKTRVEARDRAEKVFDDIDKQYVELQKLLLKYPDLDASWFEDKPDLILDGTDLHQQRILFEITTRLFERAFLTLRTSSPSQRNAQWSGWKAYVEDFCKKASYQRFWLDDYGPVRSIEDGDAWQYDKNFEAFIDQMMWKYVSDLRHEATLLARRPYLAKEPSNRQHRAPKSAIPAFPPPRLPFPGR